jgi:leucine-zipper of insertion element IS481
MPWWECRKVDERLRFVARLLEGEKMAVLCREFDISRKTGYKIFARYKCCGLEGLKDRSRRSYRQANRLPFQIGSDAAQRGVHCFAAGRTGSGLDCAVRPC